MTVSTAVTFAHQSIQIAEGLEPPLFNTATRDTGKAGLGCKAFILTDYFKL